MKKASRRTSRYSSVLVAPFATLVISVACRPLGAPGNGRLEIGPSERPVSGDAVLGRFHITLGGNKGAAVFSVRDRVTDRIVLSSLPGRAFVTAAVGSETVHEKLGSFFLKDRIRLRCLHQEVQSFVAAPSGVRIVGSLSCEGGRPSVGYTLDFSMPTPRRLRFQVSTANPEVNRLYLHFASDEQERFFGFGEQFTYFDLKGKRVPILVMEQGVGRGAQPITFGADVTAKSGGDWHTSYAPVPFTMTSRLRALFLENYQYSVFDMRADDRFSIEAFSGSVDLSVISGSSPGELLEEYTLFAGRQQALPDWVHRGAIVGMQGGTQAVRRVLGRLDELSVPIAAFWLQDWQGQRVTNFGKQLWWNWELDHERYPGWNELRETLAKRGARLMVYINPFLVDASGKAGHRRNLFAEADRLGLLIKDSRDRSYIIEHVGFPTALLDLSYPKTRAWVKDVIKKNLIAEAGASGWMADFGEGLPFDARLHEGSPREYHNRYPEEWARVNREAVREAGREGDIVFFTRSGYTRSPRHSTLFWLGDQLVSWDRYDGIKTAVTGLLSGGLSGYAFNHSDIGGYTTITNPLMNYHRTKELQMRWAELAAFNVVFRTHEGNRPDANHQFHSDPETLAHFARMARIFAALFDYRKRLVREASERGWPVVRPLFFHYPEDTRTYAIHFEQFLLGSDILVAPVLDPGAVTKKLYLPKGSWVNLWSGESATGPVELTVSAPLGQPPVFFRAGSAPGIALRASLARQKLL